MSTATPTLAVPRSAAAALAKDYVELVKLRVTSLIVMTAWAGYFMGSAKSGVSSLGWGLLHALLGIGLVSAGKPGIILSIECQKLGLRVSWWPSG